MSDNSPVSNSARIETMAKISCILGGAGWGLFWIPLRYMDGIGVTGVWATFAFFFIPAPAILGLIIWRGKVFLHGGWRLHILGFFCALANVIYAVSVLYTEVVRAMVLYYMTPIWSFILAWIFLREVITPARFAAIFLGAAGMMVLFDIDTGFPAPRNSGDWMGLAGGFTWAIAAVLMRRDPEHSAIDMTSSFFFWAIIIAAASTLLPFTEKMPDVTVVVDNLYWLFPVLVMLVIPTVFFVMWGSPLLNPGVVGLLFMTEISVGAVTAAIWANEPFGFREILGITLVSLAGLTEFAARPFAEMWRRRDKTRTAG
jgi:drug/metabolite transporter (DMT)-like permease